MHEGGGAGCPCERRRGAAGGAAALGSRRGAPSAHEAPPQGTQQRHYHWWEAGRRAVPCPKEGPAVSRKERGRAHLLYQPDADGPGAVAAPNEPCGRDSGSSDASGPLALPAPAAGLSPPAAIRRPPSEPSPGAGRRQAPSRGPRPTCVREVDVPRVCAVFHECHPVHLHVPHVPACRRPRGWKARAVCVWGSWGRQMPRACGTARQAAVSMRSAQRCAACGRQAWHHSRLSVSSPRRDTEPGSP